MNKTPVSILQEMMVRNGLNPNYELIHDGGGTHLNTFTFQVTCDGLTATGTGRCKKDAKHEAAKAMLETIAKVRGYPQLPASPAQSPVRTPLPPQMPTSPKIPLNVPFINAIGALQEVCGENNLQEPVYEAVSDVGPPHARVFTVQCTVSTFKEEGVATTKKQAKHDAAKKMLDRIMDVVSNTNTDDLCAPALHDEETRRHEIVNNEIAKARYPELSRLPVIKKTNLGVKISEYHTRLKNTYDESVRYEAIKKLQAMMTDYEHRQMVQTIDQFHKDQMGKEFEDILLTLAIEYRKVVLETEQDPEGAMVAVKLDTSPEIVEIGFGKSNDEAEIKAMISIMQALILLLQ